MEDILARVKGVTADILKLDIAGIGDTARFNEDLGGDSVKAAEWIAMLELEFDKEMDARQAQKIRSISDAVEFFSN